SCRFHDRIVAQHRTCQESWACGTGSRSAERRHREDSETRTEKSEVSAQLEFYPGHVGECAANQHLVPNAVFDLPSGNHYRSVFFLVALFVFYLRAAAGTRKRHQYFPRDGSIVAEFPGHSGHATRSEASRSGPDR